MNIPRPASGLSADGARSRSLKAFQRSAGIRFRSTSLLNQAFCHRSYANESGRTAENNERLEFLGDSVLGLVVAEYLFRNLESRPEGDLARIKSVVVSEASLAGIARSLEVDRYLLVGKGEEHSGGRGKKAILADATEAIIGAYFLDSGFRRARRFVLRLLVPEIRKVLEDRHQKDYKTLLQEYVQREYHAYPKYSLVKKAGPDHDRTFWVTVEVNGREFGPGSGKNKKTAEQHAARDAWEALDGDS